MRHTLIIAACALSIFAAPIPDPDPLYRPGGRSVARDSLPSRKREAFDRGSHPRDINDTEDDVDVNITDEDEVLSAALSRPKGNHGTDDGDQEEVEARAIRNEGVSHGSKPKGSNRKREPTIRPVKDQKRADEDENIFEAHAGVNEGEQSVPDNALPDVDIAARSSARPSRNGAVCVPEKATNRCGLNIRIDESQPDLGFGVDESLIERSPEPGYTRNSHSYRRSATPEPGYTRPSTKREAGKGGYTRPSTRDEGAEARSIRGLGLKRTAEAEANPGGVRGSNGK